MIVLPGRSSSWGGFAAHTDDTSLASLYVADDWSTAGGKITQWNDSSGNARHLEDNGVSSRPTDNTTYATFNGTSNFLTCADHMFDANGATCFMVVANVPDAPFKTLLGESGTGSPRYLLYSQPGSGSEHRIQIWNDTPTDIGTSDVTTNDPAFTTPAQIIEFVDTGSNLSTFFDGSAQHNMSYTRSGSFSFTQFVLGGFYTTYLVQAGGADVYRLLVTYTTDSTTRDNHRNLLASDYGITL